MTVPSQARPDSTPLTDTEDDPYVDDFGDELECIVCGGNGDCDDNANPLWDCDDQLHDCHSCGGTGMRRDMRYW